jgi:hypothetical protein
VNAGKCENGRTYLGARRGEGEEIRDEGPGGAGKRSKRATGSGHGLTERAAEERSRGAQQEQEREREVFCLNPKEGIARVLPASL